MAGPIFYRPDLRDDAVKIRLWLQGQVMERILYWDAKGMVDVQEEGRAFFAEAPALIARVQDTRHTHDWRIAAQRVLTKYLGDHNLFRGPAQAKKKASESYLMKFAGGHMVYGTETS